MLLSIIGRGEASTYKYDGGYQSYHSHAMPEEEVRTRTEPHNTRQDKTGQCECKLTTRRRQARDEEQTKREEEQEDGGGLQDLDLDWNWDWDRDTKVWMASGSTCRPYGAGCGHQGKTGR